MSQSWVIFKPQGERQAMKPYYSFMKLQYYLNNSGYVLLRCVILGSICMM